MYDLWRPGTAPSVGLLAVFTLLLAACVAPPRLGLSQAAENGGQATRDPATATTLNILYWQAPTSLNPYQSIGTKDLDAAAILLEPLAHIDEQDKFVPFLAAEIPTIENGGVAADGTSVTWKLKPDVKWSDGSAFTAGDVVFTWQYCSTPESACTYKSNFDAVDKVEALDPLTVKVTWKAPNPNPYQVFTSYTGTILQQAQFANCIGVAASADASCQTANLAPIGTNAWKLKEFRPGDTIVYVRNEHFRDAANVYFDTIVIKGGGDAATAARAVCETGEVDYAWNLQVQKAVLEPILAAGKCDAVSGGSYGVERIEINFANPDPALGEKRSDPDQPHPILSDLKVRQAIAKAVDRQGIADQLYGTGGKPTCNIVVAPAQIDSPNTTCARDVAGAKRLLAEAGWSDTNGNGTVDKDNQELVLSFQTSVNGLRQSEQAIIKQNLSEVGIQVELKAIDPGVYFGGNQGNSDTLNKFYADIQMYSNPPDSANPAFYFAGWLCANANSSANLWQGGNANRYCNQAYDDLYAQFAKEFDPARRAALAIQLNDFLVNDVATIPLINRVTPFGKAKDLTGPTPNTFDSKLWNIATWARQ